MIASDFVAQYDSAQFSAIALHCFDAGQAPAYHQQWFDLNFPIALDFDSELFRAYRIPHQVYPLNVVIDAQGNVAHIGSTLEDAKAVIDLLLP